jgi:hypothetical protein
VKSMERYNLRSFVVLLYACSCIFVLVTVSRTYLSHFSRGLSIRVSNYYIFKRLVLFYLLALDW